MESQSKTHIWEIESGPNDQIAPDKYIEVPILLVGNFPKAEIFWHILYTDFRGNEYSLDSAENTLYEITNKFAFDFKEKNNKSQ